MRTLACAVAACALAAQSAAAAIVIDQDQPVNGIALANPGTGIAQSFQQANDNIAGAGVLLHDNFGSTGTVTIQLWDALPTSGGTLLASGSETGTEGAYVDVFWSPVDISPAATYFLVFAGTSSLAVSGSNANPYSPGQAYANSFNSFPNHDFVFRTYAELETGEVPEPPTLAIFGILAGLCLMGRWGRGRETVRGLPARP